jgi:CRISPR/Cas system-associated exonuclease Cas4 (RecB family)
MSDERKGLPSASSVHRYAVCPGSFLLEQTIPEPPTSADANLGNRVHAALAGEKVSPQLSDEETRLVDLCSEQEARLVIEHFGGVILEPMREVRLWGFDLNLEESWSGKPDAVYMYAGRALVIDYKTGRNKVEAATANLQLRALAVLVWEMLGVSDVTVAVIQPLTGQPTVCSYTAQDIVRSAQQIGRIMRAVKMEGQPRNPTPEGCKYCKAKAVCPEAREAALAPPVVNAPAAITPDAIAATLTNETLSEFLKRVPQAEAVIEACRAEARRRLEQGDTVPGWKLKPGATRDTITRPDAVFDRFLTLGGTQQQFMPAVTIAKGKIKEALKEATGEKGKALEARLEALLFECIESKQGAATLVQEEAK